MLKKLGDKATFKNLLDLKFGCQVEVMASSVSTSFWKYNANFLYKGCYSLDLCIKYPLMAGNVDTIFLKSIGTVKMIWIRDNKGCAHQTRITGCH